MKISQDGKFPQTTNGQMSNGNSKENPDKEEEGEDTGEIQGGVDEQTRQVEVSETLSGKEWLKVVLTSCPIALCQITQQRVERFIIHILYILTMSLHFKAAGDEKNRKITVGDYSRS